jgi:hypothetical protein
MMNAWRTKSPSKRAKRLSIRFAKCEKAAERWVNAVNQLVQHGEWHYLLVTDPGALGKAVNVYATAH